MPYTTPWSNFHELNLDWLLEQVKQIRTELDSITGSSTPFDGVPSMDGVADPGDSVNYARGNHVHPTDTSRAAADDLTQEITDRGDADLTLAGDIAAVDAKIKLANTAPIMDDSSATAGVSDFMARADHVHPTDTSRASKSEFDTLKATVDGLSGGASPYDVNPLMDGVASYGVIGAYSRGDHVHPSDTSKLDVAGGTITGDLSITGDQSVGGDQSITGDLSIGGDLSVSGALLDAQKSAYASSDSITWLRFANIPQVAGTQVTIYVQKKGGNTPAEFHIVTLEITESAVKLYEEHSYGTVLYIDKIRYSNAGYVDIHSDQTYACDISMFIEPHAATETAQTNIEMIATPYAIADAPAGETLTTIDLSMDGINRVPITLSGGATASDAWGGCWVAKISRNLALLHLGINNLTANANNYPCTVPAGYRPLLPSGTICLSDLAGQTAMVYVEKYDAQYAGTVRVRPEATTILCEIIYICE